MFATFNFLKLQTRSYFTVIVWQSVNLEICSFLIYSSRTLLVHMSYSGSPGRDSSHRLFNPALQFQEHRNCLSAVTIAKTIWYHVTKMRYLLGLLGILLQGWHAKLSVKRTHNVETSRGRHEQHAKLEFIRSTELTSSTEE